MGGKVRLRWLWVTLALVAVLFGLTVFGCDCDRDWSVTSNVTVFTDDCGSELTKFSYTVSWDNWNSSNGRPTKLEVFVDQNICPYIVDHSSEYSGCQADRVTFTFSNFQFGESKTVWFTLDGDWSSKSGSARLTIVYQGHTCCYQVQVPNRRSNTSCDCEDYDVDFVSAVYDAGTNRTTFTYQATSTGSPGLSHFILEIPVNSCVHDRWISGGEWVNPDYTTGVSGLKFDGGAGTYTFYLEGDWSSSAYRETGEVTTKAGTDCICECITTLLPTGCPPQGADVWVTKSDSPDPVLTGQVLTYTIQVGNDGPATAQNVVLRDYLSDVLNDPEYSTDGGSSWSDYTSGTSVNLGNLSAGSSVTVLIRATVGCTNCCEKEISNTATVSTDSYDPDPSDNSTIITTTVVDGTPPEIVVEAQDLSVECDGEGNLVELALWLAAHGGAQAVDDCSGVAWTNDYSPDNFIPGCCETGYVDVTFTATDGCGNSSTTTARFTIVDTTAPILIVPGDVTVECDESTDPDETGWATATDNCCSADEIVISYTDEVTLDGCCGSGTIVRTWTATDACGNTASGVQVITVVDTTPPVITVDAQDLTVECDGQGNLHDLNAWLAVQGGAVAEDACCDEVTWTNDYVPENFVPGDCPGTGYVDVTFTVSDDCGNSGSTSARFTIVDTTPPVARDDSATTDEGTPVLIDVMANDTDLCSPNLSIVSVGNPEHGTAEIVGDEVRYTPDPDYNGVDHFPYTVQDCSGNQDSATVTVTIVSVNDPPVAVDDSATTPEDTPVTIGVVANDYDIDGTVVPSTVTIASGPSHGTVVNNGDGTVTYTPTPGFHGTDSFTYTVEDNEGAVSNVATVTITVTPIYELTITVEGTGSGTTDPSPGVHTYPPGTVVTLSATPDPGSRFDGWTGPNAGDIVGDQIVMDGDKDLVANFSLIPVSLSVDKVGSATEMSVGDTIDYTIVVTNTGEDTLTDIRVVDDLLGLDETVPSLSPGANVVFSGAYATTAADLPEVVNEVTASADYFGRTIRDSDSWTVVLTYTSAMELTKGAFDSEGKPLPGAAPGDEVVYRYTLVNTGNVPISDLTLVDDVLGEISGVPTGDLDGDGLLDVDETWVYEAVYTVTDADPEQGYVENTAVARGTDPLSNPVEATATYRLEVVAGGGGEAVTACDGKVVISEVAWAGTIASPEDEWIELRNVGNVPVDLTGWVIRWRKKDPQTPGEEQWRVVELTGVIPPSDASPCLMEPEPMWTSFDVIRREVDGIVYWELRARADVARRDPGYFLLERRDDDTVKDVPAGVVYDPDGKLNLDLPDDGAIIELVDASGRVVDTANADPSYSGWAAGDLYSRATMERIDPLGPDVRDNWHTNYGLLAYGQDRQDHELLATAGGRNEGRITWTALPEGLAPLRPETTVTLPIDVPQEAQREGWPRLIVGAETEEEVAGGGAAVAYGAIRSVRRDSTYVLSIDPAALLPGEYEIWVVRQPGLVVLLALTR